MADAGIKKIIIRKAFLPALDSDKIGYVFRYRIVSEDKNRTSQWSPVNIVLDNSITSVSGSLQVGENTVSAVWGDELNRPKYDVFVGFDGATPTYHGTTPIHSYEFIKTGTTNVRVIIQIESSKKQLNQALQIYNSGSTSIVLPESVIIEGLENVENSIILALMGAI
jgi:hypothetical protein